MKKGFTLIELLVAISIIAVLSIIGLNTFSTVQSKARDSVRKNDLTTLATALALYQETNGEYLLNSGSCIGGPAPADTLYTDPNFKKFISGDLPADPKTKNHYCYATDEKGLTYKLYAKLDDGTDYILTSEDYIAQASPTPTSSFLPPPTPSPTPTPTPSPTPTPTPTPPPTPLPQSPDYKRVFATSATHNGNFGGLSGADQICQGIVDTRSFGGTWKAWLSDGTTSASSRLTHYSIPYKRIDGPDVANNWTDLTDGTLLARINVDEFLSTISTATGVWTGTRFEGLGGLQNCSYWTGASSGRIGILTNVNSAWTNSGESPACSETHRLYCFEQ